MASKKAFFIFTNEDFSKLSEVKTLKKMYKNNDIHCYEIVDSEETINILSLEESLKQYDTDLSNVDLISDKDDLIYSAYRIYQNHFQNFIYIESPKTIRKPVNEPIFIENIFKVYNGIENENINSKIFVNINNSNYMSVMDKFSNICGNLSLLENYDARNIETKKNIVNKCYWVNEKDNIFIDFEANVTEDIFLYGEEKSIINQFSKITVINDTRIAAYYVLYSIKKFGAENFLVILDELTKIFDEKKFIEFERFFIELLDRDDEFNIHSKIVLYELLFPYREELHVMLYEKIMGYIYSGKLEWKYWKSLIVMFYAFNFGKELKLTDDVYRTVKEVNIAIAEIIEKQVDFKIEKKDEVDNKKVVITMDQLLTLFHSPTNVLRSQLESLLRETDYEYHIIVEENMILTKDEYVLGFIKYMGNSSKRTVPKFCELFDSNRVKVHLMDEETDIITRVKTIVQTVNEINPKFIFSLSYYSTAQNILYKYYPIINSSFGHEYLPAKAHLYLYKNDKRAKQLARKFKDRVLINHYIQPPSLIPRTKEYTREDFGYTQDDFIIITSGNRIKDEIDNELIEKMGDVLKRYPRMKWLLVGSSIPNYMLSAYSEEMLENQIKHIPYEQDLIALNEICDISINPNRIGGGYSVGTCVLVDVPVLMTTFESDGMVFLGMENTCGESYDDVIRELILCYEDDEYRINLLSKQKEYTKDRLSDNTKQLIVYFNNTVENFRAQKIY